MIGSRTLGNSDKHAHPPHARFGNWLATSMIRVFFNHRYTDLGPFRAIRYPSLQLLNMEDKTWGWTVEMQIKAIQKGLRVIEVPVSYRRRIGKSKISGTISGSIKAGAKIISTILKYCGSLTSSLLRTFLIVYYPQVRYCPKTGTPCQFASITKRFHTFTRRT